MMDDIPRVPENTDEDLSAQMGNNSPEIAVVEEHVIEDQVILDLHPLAVDDVSVAQTCGESCESLLDQISNEVSNCSAGNTVDEGVCVTATSDNCGTVISADVHSQEVTARGGPPTTTPIDIEEIPAAVVVSKKLDYSHVKAVSSREMDRDYPNDGGARRFCGKEGGEPTNPVTSTQNEEKEILKSPPVPLVSSVIPQTTTPTTTTSISSRPKLFVKVKRNSGDGTDSRAVFVSNSPVQKTVSFDPSNPFFKKEMVDELNLPSSTTSAYAASQRIVSSIDSSTKTTTTDSDTSRSPKEFKISAPESVYEPLNPDMVRLLCTTFTAPYLIPAELLSPDRTMFDRKKVFELIGTRVSDGLRRDIEREEFLRAARTVMTPNSQQKSHHKGDLAEMKPREVRHSCETSKSRSNSFSSAPTQSQLKFNAQLQAMDDKYNRLLTKMQEANVKAEKQSRGLVVELEKLMEENELLKYCHSLKGSSPTDPHQYQEQPPCQQHSTTPRHQQQPPSPQQPLPASPRRRQQQQQQSSHSSSSPESPNITYNWDPLLVPVQIEFEIPINQKYYGLGEVTVSQSAGNSSTKKTKTVIRTVNTQDLSSSILYPAQFPEWPWKPDMKFEGYGKSRVYVLSKNDLRHPRPIAPIEGNSLGIGSPLYDGIRVLVPGVHVPAVGGARPFDPKDGTTKCFNCFSSLHYIYDCPNGARSRIYIIGFTNGDLYFIFCTRAVGWLLRECHDAFFGTRLGNKHFNEMEIRVLIDRTYLGNICRGCGVADHQMDDEECTRPQPRSVVELLRSPAIADFNGFDLFLRSFHKDHRICFRM